MSSSPIIQGTTRDEFVPGHRSGRCGRSSQRLGATRERNGRMEIIGVIVAGIIIGLLGKFVAPGNKDNIPIWLTILCGIGGVIIGWFVYTAFGGNGSPGVDWVRWIVAIVISAILVVIASTVTGRNTGSRVGRH